MHLTHPEAGALLAAAHELRNHVQSILALADNANRHLRGPGGGAWLCQLRSATESLRDIAEDWIGQGDAPRDFDPREEARRILAAHAPAARRKSIALHRTLSRSCPRWVSGDRRAFRTLLANLVGNAVKFTPRGEVRLRVDGDRVGVLARLRVTVDDTGPGLPQAAAGDLQALGEASRRRGGSGLGLRLAGEAAARLGGNLRCAEAPGGGSRFTAELMLPIAMISPGVSAPTHRVRVLVVEDHPANRAFALRHLADRGHAVRGAENARTALRLCRTHGFEVALIDLGLPDMPGQTLARRLQAASPGLVAVAWSGSRPPTKGGFESHLAKPCAAAEIVAAAEQAARAAESLGDVASARRILLRQRKRECDRLDAARQSGQASRISDEAHRARGALALAGLDALAELARRAEREAAAGRPREAGRALGKVSAGLRRLGQGLA